MVAEFIFFALPVFIAVFNARLHSGEDGALSTPLSLLLFLYLFIFPIIFQSFA
jgi:hypothetical protein